MQSSASLSVLTYSRILSSDGVFGHSPMVKQLRACEGAGQPSARHQHDVVEKQDWSRRREKVEEEGGKEGGKEGRREGEEEEVERGLGEEGRRTRTC